MAWAPSRTRGSSCNGFLRPWFPFGPYCDRRPARLATRRR
jgi:hypothetical protein